jgi:transcriptional regulator with XRE-family HTH domain
MKEFLIADEAILDEIGDRLARRRIESGLTQSALARQAGVSRSTVERLEAGHSTQMSSFIRILRVLGLLEQFVAVIPESGPRPMDLLKRKVRQRASKKTQLSMAESTREWTWSDDS